MLSALAGPLGHILTPARTLVGSPEVMGGGVAGLEQAKYLLGKESTI